MSIVDKIWNCTKEQEVKLDLLSKYMRYFINQKAAFELAVLDMKFEGKIADTSIFVIHSFDNWLRFNLKIMENRKALEHSKWVEEVFFACSELGIPVEYTFYEDFKTNKRLDTKLLQ